ncbi:aldehyde dehydrogenase family protein [Tunturibacter empetritectus]|uniref:Acyl-CoA reductase-like NAD-dependent aldehyde dehydrogenase n=1 Tax=Tunturiibacter empetritectus TaxID=3069691 RepID=A0A7W8MU47_9BACT|nr:aldehyde dehydrogenase family protein [Edaphobacter lichenicola]MBB5319510.1 acyl-CoA reductase-like NAD-dependent aldehyde dehydrogenase [Edaphobacter lichenicola]
MKAITPHYIDGKFVEPHGREVMDSINPTNNNVIGSVTLADEEDAKRAIAAAKRAFASFGGTSKEERAAVLRRLQKVVTARIHDLTTAMVEEYGGVHHFSKLIVQMAAIRFSMRRRHSKNCHSFARGIRRPFFFRRLELQG